MVMSTVRESGGWSMEEDLAQQDPNEEEEELEDDDVDEAAPMHPVPTMQGAFEESMTETMHEDEPEIPDRYSKADSVTRRKMLLEQDQYERTVAGRWKQKPGERFHPLWKLVAQISFGMHLLQQGLAKSDEEVLKILQTHVDEVDGFLERTTEDFDLAQGDINERIRYLKLPLEHGTVFDQMLADRAFRVAIVDGNEKIEHIIDRTAAAMNDALKDVQKGLDATRELAKYMTRVDKQWANRTEEHDSVYLAMIGNTEGWTRAFLTLQSKGGHLRKALVQLGGIVAEMQRRAGAASRKNLLVARIAPDGYHVESRPDSPQSLSTPPRSPMKPLPTAPDPSARHPPQNQYLKSQRSRSNVNSPRADTSATTMENNRPKPPNEAPSHTRSPNVGRQGGAESSRTGVIPEADHGYRDLNSRSMRSPNLGVPGRGPELSRNTKSPEPYRRSPEPHSIRPEPLRNIRNPKLPRNVRSQETLRPSQNLENLGRARSPDYNKFARSPSPIQEYEDGDQENESSLPYKTPAQIMAQMEEASKPPSMPQRSESRRRSLIDRTGSLLRKKRQSLPAEHERRSGASLPLQDPSFNMSPSQTPTSPQSVIRRLSSRRSNHQRAISMSSYSGSPTSMHFASENPPVREDSPAYHTRHGERVPTQSSYGSISFLPQPERVSPFANSFPGPNIPEVPSLRAAASSPKAQQSAAALSTRKLSVPDDSEGNVNIAHPLLREARHANFSSRTAPGTPGNATPRDLPLRNYLKQPTFTASNPDFTHRQQESIKPPKRTSSMPYDPNTNTALNDSAIDLHGKRSLTPTQSQPITSTISSSILTRATTAPAQGDLGVHPAHRISETDAVHDLSPSPNPSMNSGASEVHHLGSATPPPIATTRSDTQTAKPPSRFPPAIPKPTTQQSTAPVSSQQGNTADDKDEHHAPHPGHPVPINDLKKGANSTDSPTAAPFYLNPASSSALVNFLAPSRSPSPPHPGTRTEPGTPGGRSTPQFANTADYFYRANDASPPPPGPGGGGRSRTAPWDNRDDGAKNSLGTHAAERERKGSVPWRKVGTLFGAGKMRKWGSASGAGGGGGTSKVDLTMNVANSRGGSGRSTTTLPHHPHLHHNATRGPCGGSGSGGDHDDGSAGAGFVGVGKDGQWISRKNFIRS